MTFEPPSQGSLPNWPPPPPPPPLPPPPSYVSPPWAAPPLRYPAVPAKRQRRSWLPVAVPVAVFVLLLGVVLVPAILRQRAAAFPKTWDARVVDLATFVENERGLKFKHPIAFQFMTEKAFLAEVSGTRVKPNISRQLIHDAILRTRGYVGPTFDSVKAESDFVSNVTGFYSDADQKMRVRGTEVTSSMKVTLVHELTHALQDQQFSIRKVRASVQSDEAEFAVQSLIEGDARDIENAYVASLPGAEQQAILAEEDATRSDTGNTPDALQVQYGAPYELGALMVGMLRHLGGVDRLNEAFTNPPSAETAVALPFVPAASAKHTVTSAFAFAGASETIDDRDLIGFESVGVLSTFLTLSSRLDPTVAWRAASGWKGEAIQVVRRNGVVCTDSALKGRAAPDTARLFAAYQLWAEATPTKTTVALDNEVINISSCDPGSAAPVPKTGIFSALYRLSELDQILFVHAEKNGFATAARASCAALKGLLDIDGSAIDDDVFRSGTLTPTLAAQAATSAESC